MVFFMKRAAILVLAIATLVLVVSPSTSLLAKTTKAKSGTNAPSVVTPNGPGTPGPSTNSGGGGTGGGNDQGDADGLSGIKLKPGSTSGFNATTGRVSITMMMWWRYIVFIR